MKMQRLLAMGCVVSLFANSVQAATYTSVGQVVAQVSADSTLISGWANDQFKDAAAFNSTSGDVVPSQLKIFGIEAGIEGVASSSKVDVDGFHNLGTQLIDTSKINVYNRMPFPSVIAHAKVGLPFGIDAGIRVGGIPAKSFDNGSTQFDIQNTIFGLDLRKKLIEDGLTSPFGLTLGLNYTHANGHIDINSPYTATSGNVVINGQTFTPSFNATGEEHTDWKTDSVGLQAILNKKILFINPYIGAAINHNSGTIDSSIMNVGTLTLTGPTTETQALSAGGTASEAPDKWDLRGLAGIEFSILPFIRLGIGGEVASENRLAGSVGLRVQFR